MAKTILRTISLFLSLPELAAAFGKDDWSSANSYLDVDDSDTYFDGSFAKYNQNDSEIGLFAKYCPSMLDRAHHYALSDAYCNDLSNQRRAWILKTLEKIDIGTAEYEGRDSNGSVVQIKGIAAKIFYAKLHGDIVEIGIQNPEHLINDIINSYFRSSPHEILVDEVLTEAQLKKFFLSNIGDFYGYYAEIPQSNFESNAYAENKAILEHLKELDMDEITQDIGESVVKLLSDSDKSEIENDLDKLERFFKISGLAKEAFSHAREVIQNKQDELNDLLRKAS